MTRRCDAAGAPARQEKESGSRCDVPAEVAVLLCTYQGERFLRAQLDSILSQTYRHWKIHVSDDGSSDGTTTILNAYCEQLGRERFSMFQGPRKGFTANFLSLACRAEIQADYYAYADQDDIWLDDKLERAVKWLASVPSATPALYCSRTVLVDMENTEIGLSPPFGKPPGFTNALAQNIAGGNTMVFNAAACALIRQGGADVPAAAHDWWTYMLVTGCGGQVFYDRTPSLRYRQHGANLMGLDTSGRARLERWRLLWHGRLHRWNEGNLAALGCLRESLTEENRKVLEHFSLARTRPLPLNLVELWRSGVHRQSLMSNLSMIAALVFRKM